MLDDFSQAGADSGEHLPQVQVGHHRVVDFQQKLHAVPFVLQLLLGRLGARSVQHIVHGNSDLVRHLLHEVDLCLLIDSSLIAPKSHCP